MIEGVVFLAGRQRLAPLPEDHCLVWLSFAGRANRTRVRSSSLFWRPAEYAWTHDSHVAPFMRTRGVRSLAELRQASGHCHRWFWNEALREVGLGWKRDDRLKIARRLAGQGEIQDALTSHPG